MVKTVKSETSLNLTCANYDTRLSNDEIFSHVRAVEQMLKIESSEHINETLTDEALQTAAEIFIYLSTCPKHDMKWFLSWSSFYTDLFLTQSAQNIILTLNRMMKITKSQDKNGKLRAEKLLLKVTSLLALKFEEIEGLLPENVVRNTVAKNNKNKIPNGMHCSLILRWLIYFYIHSRYRWHLHQSPSSYINPQQPNLFSVSLDSIL